MYKESEFIRSPSMCSEADFVNFREKKKESLLCLFLEFCANSSIHGIKYFGCRRRSFVEKLWWGFVFLVCFFGCGRLILNIYQKWDTTPVIVSFAEKSTPVWQIPFPAVTICPETKAKSMYFNFTEAFHTASPNMTEEEKLQLESLAQICDAHLFSGRDIFSDSATVDMVDRMKGMSVEKADMLMACKWRNVIQQNCTEFKEIITEEGICYTFNTVPVEELLRTEHIHDDYQYLENIKFGDTQWSLEEGYNPEADSTTYPLRVLGAGAKAGLNVLMKLSGDDLEYICRGPVQGFKILLHSPSEYPQVSKQYFRVPLKQEVIVAVKPQMITTSQNLRSYSPERRQCFFNSERKLKYFKVYTQQNCELECLANYTLEKCGCVKFSMVRGKDTPICGGNKIDCFSKAEDDLLALDMSEGLVGSGENKRGKTQCNCLPACTSIQYDAEMSQADFDWISLFNAYKSPLSEFPNEQFARLTIFFKDAQFITSKRSELYGTTDFLANCGGLLGLFMGVSILSIVELVYYCTIRPYYIVKRQRKARKRCPTLEVNGFTFGPEKVIEKSDKNEKDEKIKN